MIVEKHYLHTVDAVVLERGAIAGLRKLQSAGFAFIGGTNQSGVDRGYFPIDDVHAVHRHIDGLLAQASIKLEGWDVCPHAPEHDCQCRKPGPGLAIAAAADHDLDLQKSYVVGDKLADVGLADAVGAIGILVLTGHGKEDAAEARGAPESSARI